MKNDACMTVSERLARRGVRIYTGLVLGFLVIPVLVIVPLSFNDSTYFSYPMSGFTFGWYETLFASEDWRRAFLNSTTLAGTAAAQESPAARGLNITATAGGRSGSAFFRTERGPRYMCSA